MEIPAWNILLRRCNDDYGAAVSGCSKLVNSNYNAKEKK
jgi:hypothetical protein